MSLQRPLDSSTNTQCTAASSPTTQGTLAPLLTLPTKMGTYKSAQKMVGPLSPRPEALVMLSSATVAPRPLPVTPQPLSPFPSSQETPSNVPHIPRGLDLSQYGSGPPLNVMPSTQWQQGTPSSSEGSVAPLSSAQGAVGQSPSAQHTLEHSIFAHGTLRHCLSGPGDMVHPLSSQGTKGPLQSVGVNMGTYLHAQGSPGHLKNVSDFPRHKQSGPDPYVFLLQRLLFCFVLFCFVFSRQGFSV